MSSEIEEFPNCIICKTRKANVLFDCIHNNSCSQCTTILAKCPECYHVIEERLLMIFSNNNKRLTLTYFEE